MVWGKAKEYGSKIYGWYGENQEAMDEVDKKVAELFSSDMTPARQLPILASFWMIVDGQYWYVTHDDLALTEIASTYLPVDRNVESSWNKRWNELWSIQPEQFKFMATNHGSQTNPYAVERLSNGELAYWGPLPNGTPVLMPQESVNILMNHIGHTGQTVKNFDPPPEPDPDPIKAPNIFANKQDPGYSAVLDTAEIISNRSVSKKPNYFIWVGGSLLLVGAIGTGIWLWRKDNV